MCTDLCPFSACPSRAGAAAGAGTFGDKQGVCVCAGLCTVGRCCHSSALSFVPTRALPVHHNPAPKGRR